MSWNHRVVVEGKGTEEEWWSIREVFYNSNGNICGMTEGGVDPVGSTLDDLRQEALHMVNAFYKDIIVLDDDFVFAPWDFDVTRGE